MSESRFRSGLVRMIDHDLVGQAIPVETEATAGSGVPDLELCLPGGVQAWLELKVLLLGVPEAPHPIHHLRRLQARWLRDRWRLGGAAGLLVQATAARGGRRGYALVDGETTARVFLDQRRDVPWTWHGLAWASYLPHDESSLSPGNLSAGVRRLFDARPGSPG